MRGNTFGNDAMHEHGASAGEHTSAAPISPRGDPVALIAVATTKAARLALLMGGRERWRRESGYTLVPLELPGEALTPGEEPGQAAERLGRRELGCALRLQSSPWVYTASARHMVDRRAAEDGECPAPLVLLHRMLPLPSGIGGDSEQAAGLVPVEVRVYRAVTETEPHAGPESAGLLWLPLDVLRRVVLGLPLAELLAARGVEAEGVAGGALPDDVILYLPAEYGERYLLRAVAKYGVQAVLQGEKSDGPGF